MTQLQGFPLESTSPTGNLREIPQRSPKETAPSKLVC